MFIITKLPKKLKSLFAVIAVSLIVLIPAAVLAAEDVKLEGNVGAANVTAGDKDYAKAVNAKYNDVVKVQVYYNNSEATASAKTAQKVRVKIDIPNTAGKAQTIKATAKGDNTSSVDDQLAVNLEDDKATLQYVPGSAVWKHNSAAADTVKFVDEKISDEVVSSAQGVALRDQKPGDKFSATVTVLVRVMAPGVKVTKQVEMVGESNKWSAGNTAKPGETLKYLVGYQNTGNATQNKVIIRDILPNHSTLVPDTTKLTNTANPTGVTVASDEITRSGINIGNYTAGANAYLTFEVKIDEADKLACGTNDLRNFGGAQPQNMSEYFATAATTVNRENCEVKPPTPAPAPTPPPPATPPQVTPVPVYACDNLTITKGANRKITVKTDYTAKDGAKFKSASYNFGDSSQPLSTDKTTVEYTYKKDGDYSVTVVLLMSVKGKDQTATSAACSKPVNFAAPTPPAPLTPPAAPSTTVPAPNAIPNTGPGDVVEMFVGATLVGTCFHYFVTRRAQRG